MLLSLTNHQPPATDLGYLLMKHPDRVHPFELSFGRAHVFFPEASLERCTATLLLEVDPIALSRHQDPSDITPLEPYINDRPYVASSFLSVAMSQVYGTALGGRCRDKPELAAAALPLTASMPVVSCRGGERLVHALFEPLGYAVETHPLVVDEAHPEWGHGGYLELRLHATTRLKDLLTHLYVLIPVLDDEKHYWVGEAEVEKLLRMGDGWLEGHPQKALITERYLKHQRRLTRAALARLAPDELPDPDAEEQEAQAEEARLEEKLSLNELRLQTVVELIRSLKVKRVLDLGCGEGKLLVLLERERGLEKVVGLDVSVRSLEIAARRLRLGEGRLPGRVQLLHGALTYRDERLKGFELAALVEVIEHLDPSRLPALERVVFQHAQPQHVLLTTPNREYNQRYPALTEGRLRHRDHRFEWTRAELLAWAEKIGNTYGYRVQILPVGPIDEVLGPPTQLVHFTREALVQPVAGAPASVPGEASSPPTISG